ncbi:MAG: sulfatase [Aureliella sp.]
MLSNSPVANSNRQCWITVLTLVIVCSATCVAADRPNILFIAVDDLRPELACYGKQHIVSPNIDELARTGVLFERSYCMVPTCGASRASLMTSVRPSPNRFVNYLAWAEKDAASAIPLHSHFKSNGYWTESLGKIFHHKADHADGWSTPPWRSPKSGYQNTPQMKMDIRESKERFPNKKRHRGAPFEEFETADESYPDGDCARRAVQRIAMAAQAPETPFFIAVGFLKPHLPFNAPKRYWDMYSAEDIELPPNYRHPDDVPKTALHNSGELRSYAGIHPTAAVDEATAKRLIHGYYACVSYTDAQIGKVLAALEEYGVAENTIVVLWGDHGWQLGEHGMWNKHSCFETSMHAPLIMRIPKSIEGPTEAIAGGMRLTQLVEFIDIYPTLCDLAGLPTPSHVEGTSLVALMESPDSPGKPFAVGRYRAGDTIRSDQFRLSEFPVSGKNPKRESSEYMLFDHKADPSEDRNVATEAAEQVRALAAELQKRKGK